MEFLSAMAITAIIAIVLVFSYTLSSSFGDYMYLESMVA